MEKILIGTHNRGKFREIAYLLSKKLRKISPVTLKLKSPKETGKTFKSNSKIKASFFSKFVNFAVISDDSGICVKALGNRPGIYSARLAKKKGSFFKAMKYILEKLENKKDRSATFICSLSCLPVCSKVVLEARNGSATYRSASQHSAAALETHRRLLPFPFVGSRAPQPYE